MTWGSRTGRFALLRHRSFMLLLVARTTSFLGTTVATVAVPFAALEIHGSASSVGIVATAFGLPRVVLLLAGGVIADRFPRKRLMVAADIAAMIAQGLCGVLLLTGHLGIPLLAALQAVNGAAFAFFYPASEALMPLTVPEEDLPSANALLRSFTNAAAILGTALAIDASTYMVSAICCALLVVSQPVAAGAAGLLDDLKVGWKEFTNRRWLWAIVVQFSIVNALFDGTMLVLGPVQSDRHLGGAFAWGLVMACFTGGLLVGALVSFRLRPRRPLLLGVSTVLALAVPPILLSGPAPLLAVAAAALLAGTGLEIFGVQWASALQRNIPNEHLARINSYDAVGSFGLIPVGLAMAGPLSEAFGMRATLLGAAGLITVIPLAALAVPEVRQLRSPAPDEPTTKTAEAA